MQRHGPPSTIEGHHLAQTTNRRARAKEGNMITSEALLNALRPFCMSAMLALEGMLDSPPSSRSPSSSSSAADTTAMTARIAAGRRLEAALSSLHTALTGIIASFSPSAASEVTARLSDLRGGVLATALPPVLPFVMLPLQLVLAPTKSTGGEGVKADRDRGRGQMPPGVKEKALLCIAAAVRGSGSYFVQGYGTKPTANVLIGLVFTLCGLSPEIERSASTTQVSNGSAKSSGGDSGNSPDVDSIRSMATQTSGSGLSGDTDALRLACLECLEALLRAPFSCSNRGTTTRKSTTSSKSTDGDEASSSAWSEVQDILRHAAGGGVLAQLLQELLLCCQRGGEGAAGGRLGTPRGAAACLNALCSFASGSLMWRRFLPGTFSGLFRAIRGLHGGSASSMAAGNGSVGERRSGNALEQGTMPLLLGGAPLGSSGRGGGESRSKSAMAETCLATLAKVLLMCAGVDEQASSAVPVAGARAASAARAGVGGEGPDGVGSKNGGDPSFTNEDNVHGGDGNPLLVLQQLAIASNAKGANSGSHEGYDGNNNSAGSKTPISSLGAKTAASEREESWEVQTSNRLRLLLPPLLAFCRLHPGWRVRRAAANFASSLLRGSTRSSGGMLDGADGTAEEEDGRGGGDGGNDGLLAPLAPLLVEALVGLALDDMLQVSTAANDGLEGFRATLTPVRWLAMRGTLLDRICTIAEGLPALAKSADEKRLRAAFDLLAGYLSLLRFDARAALDARLSTVLSCLCQALEFDESFNVQVLEGSYDRGSGGGGHGENRSKEPSPKYYRRVLANLRQDDTLFSARRAVRLLGTYCDLPLFTDAILSSLENRPPRPPPPPPPGRRSTDDSLRLRQRPPAIDQKEQHAGDSLASTIIGRGLGDDDDRNLQRDDSDGLYRQRCLQWLRPRLPLAWLLNQALLGRVPSISPAADASSSKEAATAAAEAGAVEEIGQDPHRPGHGVAGNGRGEEQKTFMRRGLALSLLERMLASHAFTLPVARTEVTTNGYREGHTSDAAYGYHDRNGSLPSSDCRGGRSSGNVVEYTRSGAVLGRGRGYRAPGISSQVLDANATLVSIVIEALASLAEACGPQLGEAFLRRALYPLLEKAASPHPVVSQAALATLDRVRVACGDFQGMPQMLEANMDYVVDDVIRRVAATGASSRHRRRAHVGNRDNVDSTGRMTIFGGVRDGEGGGGIPTVVEAVLRIGGSAMGPALVRDLAAVTLGEVDACAWDPRQTRRSLGALRAVASCVSLPALGSNDGSEDASLSIPSPDGRIAARSGSTESEGPQSTIDGDMEEQEKRSSAGGSPSAVLKSPWFRQLFVEFAEASDVERAKERKNEGMQDVLNAFDDHQKAMGVDFPDPEEFIPEATAGEREGAEAGTGGQEPLPEPDSEGRKMAESQEVKTLSEVLSRSCHFLSEPRLETQALALSCMRDCVLKLASAGADAALLPHVHRAWRPLVTTFREHLTPLPAPPPGMAEGNVGVFTDALRSRRAALLHSLDVVDALVDVCGDFLSSKVAEDLWPLLKLLLLQYTATFVATDHSRRRMTTRPNGSKRGRGQQGINPARGERSGTSSSELLLAKTIDAVSASSSKYRESAAESPFPLPATPAVSEDPLTNSLVGDPSQYMARAFRTKSSAVIRRGAGHGSVKWTVGVGNRTSLDEKVVARALKCLEGLCRSRHCERFMTPLAREVALAVLPCLSSAGADAIRSSAEALFERLSYLDGDSVWLLLMQTLDTAARDSQQNDQHRDHGERRRAAGDASSMPQRQQQQRQQRVVDDDGMGAETRTLLMATPDASVNLSRERNGAVNGDGRHPAAMHVGNIPFWQPYLVAPASAGGLDGAIRERTGPPLLLAETRSVFPRQDCAGDCVPAAARLLELTGASGMVGEHF